MSFGVTAPDVALKIFSINALSGLRLPVLSRDSVTRETPISFAKSLSLVVEARSHSFSVMLGTIVSILDTVNDSFHSGS